MKMGMVLLSNMLKRFIKNGTLRVINSEGEVTGLTRDYIFKTEEKYRKQELGQE